MPLAQYAIAKPLLPPPPPMNCPIVKCPTPCRIVPAPRIANLGYRFGVAGAGLPQGVLVDPQTGQPLSDPATGQFILDPAAQAAADAAEQAALQGAIAGGLPIILDPGFLDGDDLLADQTLADKQRRKERRRARRKRRRQAQAQRRRARRRTRRANKKKSRLNGFDDALGCMNGFGCDCGEDCSLGELDDPTFGEWELAEYVAEALGEYGPDVSALGALDDEPSLGAYVPNLADYGLGALDIGEIIGQAAGSVIPVLGPAVGQALGLKQPGQAALVTTPGGQQALVLRRQQRDADRAQFRAQRDAERAKLKADREAARAGKKNAGGGGGFGPLLAIGGVVASLLLAK